MNSNSGWVGHLKTWSGPAALSLVIVALVVGILGLSLPKALPGDPGGIGRATAGQACGVYMEQGCMQLTVQSGGEIQMESGSTLDVQSGTTSTFGGSVSLNGGADLNGTTLTLGADAGIYMDESADGDYRFVMGAGTDAISYTVGNVAIGNGVPGVSLNGEDFYVEGTAEVDGAAQFDGAVTFNSTADVSSFLSFSVEPTVVTTNTVLSTAMKTDWQVLKNSGSLTVTLTLPAAAAGLQYCVFNYDGDDVMVDPQAGDQIFSLTNAAGDRILNTTAGNSICLLAIDNTYWLAIYPVGTWSDAD